jgi:putative methyltransferase (TIGR04325 family)
MSSLLSRIRSKPLVHRILVGTPWRGLYPSFAAAQAAIPPGRSIGYNSESAANIFRTYPILRKRPTDYVTLFHLQHLLERGSQLFDFGGSVGIAYYVYKQYLSLPEKMRWLVCDVPAIVEVGRERALELHSDGLEFTTEFKDANNADVLITAGTLQFVETPLARMLSGLENPPPYLLINRVPAWDREHLCTLHTIGDFLCPYQVFNREEFIQSLSAIGYKLVDSWECPESSLSIRFRPQLRLNTYQGFYFAKSPQSVKTIGPNAAPAS